MDEYAKIEEMRQNIGKPIFQVCMAHVFEVEIEAVLICKDSLGYSVYAWNEDEDDTVFISEKDIGSTYFWTYEEAIAKANENEAKRASNSLLCFYDAELLENAKAQIPYVKPFETIEEGKKVEFRRFTPLRNEKENM